MHLESNITVNQSTQQVWALFNDPYFLVKWDRSVEQIIPTSSGPTGAVGYTFDTIAPKKPGQKQGLRMSYRIIEHIPDYQTKIQLEKSNMFREAIWTMRFEPNPNGTLITCYADLKVYRKYFFMVLLLHIFRKGILTDLKILKGVIENHYAK